MFLIMSVAVVTTASILGSTVLPALAQGNGTSEVEVGLPAAPPRDANITVPTNDIINVTTAIGGYIISEASQVDASQDVGTWGSEDEASSSEGNKN